MHEDAAVQQCTQVAGARAVWGKVGLIYDAIVRSGRELDCIVRRRLGAGLVVDEHDIALLHRGYWTAFRLNKIKGIVERTAEMGDELVVPARCRSGPSSRRQKAPKTTWKRPATPAPRYCARFLRG